MLNKEQSGLNHNGSRPGNYRCLTAAHKACAAGDEICGRNNLHAEMASYRARAENTRPSLADLLLFRARLEDAVRAQVGHEAEEMSVKGPAFARKATAGR